MKNVKVLHGQQDQSHLKVILILLEQAAKLLIIQFKHEEERRMIGW